jgi:WD40 repeat protein
LTSIFISYSRKDKDAADYIANELRARGADVFIDYQGLTGGEQFTERLANEIKNRDYFVFLISTYSLASRWVKREVQWADDCEKIIIPMMLERLVMPDELFYLTRVEQVDFTNWNMKKDTTTTIEKLAKALNLPLSSQDDFKVSETERPIITPQNANKLRRIGTLKGHHMPIASLNFSSNGILLASGSYDNTVRVWEIRRQAEIRTLKGHTDRINSICFFDFNIRLASVSSDHTIRLWDVNTGNEQALLIGHRDSVLSIAFDGLRVASSSKDTTIKLWDTKTGEERLTISGHNGSVIFVGFIADGEILVSASVDNTVRLWKPRTGEQIGSFNADDSITYAALSRSSENGLIAVSSGNSKYRIQLVDSETQKVTCELHQENGPIWMIEFSPDGSLLASTALDKTIQLWDVVNKQYCCFLDKFNGKAVCVAFSPDGTLMAVGDMNGIITLWGIE